jgi:hypothetical protein
MVNNLFGRLLGNKGYVSQAVKEWRVKESDLTFITKRYKNRKGQCFEPIDIALLKGHSLIETAFDKLQNSCQIKHSHPRSVTGFMANSLSSLIAYCCFPTSQHLKICLFLTDSLPRI